MKKIIISTPLNYKPSEGKKFTLPSLTRPDQTMSIKEILQRYASGGQLTVGHDGFYEEEEPSNGIRMQSLDLVEIQQMGLKHKELIRNYENGLKHAQDEKEKAAFRKAIEEEMLAKNPTIETPTEQ